MSGELDETRAAIERTREAWRLHADLSKERAAIVRKVAGWVRGDEPPPDGATRADALERGPAWSGWDWSRRGVEVSLALWNAEREAAADARLSFLRVALDCERQAANHAEIDARAGWGDSGCAGPWRDLAARYRAVLALVEEIAGGEEGAAWREWEAACKEARRTLPLAEIEAARARLEAEAVEQQGAAVVGAKVEENDKAKPPAGRGTGKRGKRAAIKIEVAAAYMKKGTRTLQRWEKNPGLVPDEWAGYSRAVRMTGTDWEAWKVSLGMREGTQGQLRNAAKRLGDGWSSTHTTRR